MRMLETRLDGCGSALTSDLSDCTCVGPLGRSFATGLIYKIQLARDIE